MGGAKKRGGSEKHEELKIQSGTAVPDSSIACFVCEDGWKDLVAPKPKKLEDGKLIRFR